MNKTENSVQKKKGKLNMQTNLPQKPTTLVIEEPSEYIEQAIEHPTDDKTGFIFPTVKANKR